MTHSVETYVETTMETHVETAVEMTVGTAVETVVEANGSGASKRAPMRVSKPINPPQN